MAVSNKSSVKLALLGAALLGALPAAALAQRDEHGNRGQGRSNATPAPQAAPRSAPAAPAARSGWQGQPQGNWAARPAPQAAAPVANPNWAARNNGAPAGWQGRNAPQAAPAPAAQPSPRPWGQSAGRGNAMANGTFQGRPNAPAPARNDWVNRGTAGVPHYAAREGDRFRDGGRSWSRDWRSDRRYDWQEWRGYHRDIFHVGRYYAPYRDWSYRRLSIGFILDQMFWGDDYWISDPWFYHLPPAYGPYRWVRYYDDALLVDSYSGQVVDVIYGVFW